MDHRKIRLALFVYFWLFLPVCLAGEQPDGERYVKLDSAGQELPSDAAWWSMVRDRTTGLIWEVKTTDGSLHDTGNVYGWRSAHDEFIAGLNAMRFGGFSDWRLPTTDELRSIAVKGEEPFVNRDFFPNTAPTGYMSWRQCGSGEIFDEQVKFGGTRNTKKDRNVRAVRGGKEEKERH
jgi:hypothetical protein